MRTIILNSSEEKAIAKMLDVEIGAVGEEIEHMRKYRTGEELKNLENYFSILEDIKLKITAKD